MKYIVDPRGDRCYLFSLSFRELFGRIGKRKRFSIREISTF